LHSDIISAPEIQFAVIFIYDNNMDKYTNFNLKLKSYWKLRNQWLKNSAKNRMKVKTRFRHNDYQNNHTQQHNKFH